MVGAAGQDYLKAIFTMAHDGDTPTPSAIAARLGVSPPAATKMLRRLQELNLVVYARSEGLSLTTAGEKVALEMIRHHRLLETYLAEALGYSWDQVHAEAERLEHVISEEFEDRIDALLGYPEVDPHGHPIPSREGVMNAVRQIPLADLSPGDCSVIERVTDRDPEMLRFMSELGLRLQVAVEMIAKAPYGGSLTVRVEGIERAIGRELAENVFVSRPL